MRGKRLEVMGYRLRVLALRRCSGEQARSPGYGLQVKGYRLRVTDYGLQITGYRLRFTG